MKKLYFILLLSATRSFAQSPQLDIKSFQKEYDNIAQMEMLAHEKLSVNGWADSFSVASDNFDIHFYHCQWAIDPAIRYIRGKVSAHFQIVSSTNAITLDLNKNLLVDSVTYHGSKVPFLQTNAHGVEITFPTSLSVGVKDSVSIFYQGIPNASGFGAFYQGTHAGVPIVWTLSEPYGSREWWPCKNGLTDKADSIEIIVTTPSAYRTSSNGMLLSEQTIGADKICHFKHKYPIAPYLVAIASTNYVMNSDTIQVGNSTHKLISYAYPESAGGFFGTQIFAKVAYRIFNNLFGEYPFASEKYGHTQFGWRGGMEHQTNSFVVATSPNLSAHELAHQWFGDMVTCGSWGDLWLNEGFATYSTLLFIEYGFPSYFNSTLNGMHAAATSTPQGSVYVTDTTNISRLFSGALTYNKGGYVLHMLRWTLGDSAFYKGVRRYLNDPAVRYGFARTADLKRNLEQESGKNLSSFFQKWVYGEGYPNYHATWTQNLNKWASVKLNQTTSHPSVGFYDMPVALQFKNASRDTTVVVNHLYSGQTFWINLGFDADTVIIDPKLWLLSKVKTSAKINNTNTTINEVKIYPNPTPDQLIVSIKNPSDKKLEIHLFNALGQLIYRKQLTTGGQDELINLPFAHLARGVYVLKLKSEKNINVTRKIIKSR